MKNGIIIQNNLKTILNERNLTQKELAEILEEREATISDFIKLKRSTINIELLLKIASTLEIVDITEILSFKKAFKAKKSVYNTWYDFCEDGKTRFAYINDKDKLTFEVAEVSDNGMLTHQKYDISNMDKEDIINEFEKLELTLEVKDFNGKKGFYEESHITFMLIMICRYRGSFDATYRLKSIKEAKDTLNLLY